MEFEFKELGPRDLETLMSAAPGVFDNPVNAVYAAEFLGDPRHHIVVSIAAGTVVGFVSAVHYIHPDKPPELWINEVAVAPPHRRRGIAKAMLKRMFEVGQLNRCTVAWVLTDRENPAAMALYESAGGREGPMTKGQATLCSGIRLISRIRCPSARARAEYAGGSVPCCRVTSRQRSRLGEAHVGPMGSTSTQWRRLARVTSHSTISPFYRKPPCPR